MSEHGPNRHRRQSGRAANARRRREWAKLAKQHARLIGELYKPYAEAHRARMKPRKVKTQTWGSNGLVEIETDEPKR